MNKKVLFVEDLPPIPSFGRGSPRCNRFVQALSESYDLTLYTFSNNVSSYSRSDLPPSIEICHYGKQAFYNFLKLRSNHYNLILVFRPHLMEYCNNIFKFLFPSISQRPKVVYCAESLYSLRAAQYTSLQLGTKVYKPEWVNKELNLANYADCVISISNKEANMFRAFSNTRVEVVGQSYNRVLTPSPFSDRKDLVFIGSFGSDICFNADALRCFSSFCWPTLRNLIPGIQLNVVGSISPSLLSSLSSPGISFLGRRSDIDFIYNSSKLMIVPIRFNSGIPSKVGEAASAGLPMVVTDVIANLMGWGSPELLISKVSTTNNTGEWSKFTSNCLSLYTNEQLWNSTRLLAYNKLCESTLPPLDFKNHILSIIGSVI